MKRLDDRLVCGMTVAVIGGDRREQEICLLAQRAGAVVRACGIPWPASGLEGVEQCASLEAVLADADLCLLPLPLPVSDGTLYAPAASAPLRVQAGHFARMRRTALIVAGSVNEAIIAAAADAAIPIDTYGADLEGRRSRAVAVAEGALAVVIGATEHTIRGARVAVLGNGVLGQAMAEIFQKLGAETWLFARMPRGPRERSFAEVWKHASDFDVLLSTIPAAVLAPEFFRMLRSHALVVDLAAPPGVASAAEAAGARTLRAGGLGGCAPVTVGGIQWAQILALLNQVSKTRDASSS